MKKGGVMYAKNVESPELIRELVSTCEDIERKSGICIGNRCGKCPGADEYNDGKPCTENGFRQEERCSETDRVCAENARKFIEAVKG